MLVVYAKEEGTIIWADMHRNHKQGRVPLREPLEAINKPNDEWYRIERPEHLSLPPDPNYLKYYVMIKDTLHNEPPSPGVTDEQAAEAIVMLLKWWKDWAA